MTARTATRGVLAVLLTWLVLHTIAKTLDGLVAQVGHAQGMAQAEAQP